MISLKIRYEKSKIIIYEAHIDYEVCEDEKEMEEKGIDLLPAMETGQDEERMDFSAILAFIKAHNEEGGNR